MQAVAREPAQRKCGGIRTTNDNRACLAQVCHHRAVKLRAKVCLGSQTVGGGIPHLVDVHLYRDRNTGQRARSITTRQTAVGGFCRSKSLIIHALDDRVKGGVDCLDPLQHGRDRFLHRNLSCGNHWHQFAC